MIHARMNRSMLIAAAFSLSALAAPAYAAGDQASLDMCREALGAEAQNADIDFKSIRGNSLRSVTFEVNDNGEISEVTCKVRRGQIVGLDWSDARYAEKS